jgi:hypothetical protein
MVHFYRFNWSYGIFTNLSNRVTHLTLSSLMNIKEKIIKPLNLAILVANSYFFHI